MSPIQLHNWIIKNKEVGDMNTVLLTAKNKTLTAIYKENIEIQVIEGSALIIAKKRIIIPENKIIMEKYDSTIVNTVSGG